MKKQGNKTERIIVDCAIEKENFVLSFSLHNRKIGSVFYGRNGISETSNCFSSLFLRKAKKVEYVVNRQLLAAERNSIHSLFPWIMKYTTIDGFLSDYTCHINEGKSYYMDYEEACQIGLRLLCQPSVGSDGKWHIELWKTGIFLYRKWDTHVVVLNNRTFFSDLSYFQILLQEELTWKTDSLGEEKADFFTTVYPETLLNIYLRNGGRKFFRFLTSPHVPGDHLFELLGKGGLSQIADNLRKYKGLNGKADNLQEAFGLPLKCIRLLAQNNPEFLCDESDREVVRWAYARAPEIFKDRCSTITELWIRYSYYATIQDKSLGAEGYIRNCSLGKTIRYLNSQREENPFNLFVYWQNYLAQAQKIGRYVEGQFPKNLKSALNESVAILNAKYEAQKDIQFMNALAFSEEYMDTDMQENGDIYMVKRPEDKKELIEAGYKLCNCINNTYVQKIREGKIIIGLICCRENGQIIGALEIQRGTLKMTQAKGYCNEKLPFDVQTYLIRYAERKNIDISKCEDLRLAFA